MNQPALVVENFIDANPTLPPRVHYVRARE